MNVTVIKLIYLSTLLAAVLIWPYFHLIKYFKTTGSLIRDAIDGTLLKLLNGVWRVRNCFGMKINSSSINEIFWKILAVDVMFVLYAWFRPRFIQVALCFHCLTLQLIFVNKHVSIRHALICLRRILMKISFLQISSSNVLLLMFPDLF